MARTPAPYIDYHEDELAHGKITPKFKKLATEGIEIDAQIKTLKKRLDEIKQAITEEYGEDQKYTLVLPEVGTVPVVPKEQLIIADADRLKEIFGPNFENYVITTENHKPRDTLEELAGDTDAPTHDMVVECLTTKESCAVSFKPHKK